MSYQAVDAVFRHSRAKGTDQQVLVYIAHRANVEGRDAHPSRVEIVEATRLDPKTVTAAIGRLEDAGELLVTRGHGRGHRNTYDLLIMHGPAPEKGEPDSPVYEKGEKGEIGESGSPVSEGEKGEMEAVNSPFYGAEKGEPDSPSNTRSLLENPTTTIPPEVAEESGAANEALVVVVGDEEGGGETPSRALVEEMTALGVTASTAEHLARQFDADRIRRQIGYLQAEHRSGTDIRNSGGRLRKRIEDDWAPPSTPLPVRSPPNGARAPAKGYPPPSPAGADPRASYTGPSISGPPASPQSIREILQESGL